MTVPGVSRHGRCSYRPRGALRRRRIRLGASSPASQVLRASSGRRARPSDRNGKAGLDRWPGRQRHVAQPGRRRHFLQGGAGRERRRGRRGGDDRVAAHADGAVDRVRCGAGRDIVDAERNDVVAGDCEVVSRQLSVDTTTNPIGQHATEVEPDSYAFGSSIVSVFQVGRVFSGGAVAIGYSTSTETGRRGRRACYRASLRRHRKRASPSGRATRRSPTTPSTTRGWLRRLRSRRPRARSTSTSAARLTAVRGRSPSSRSPAERRPRKQWINCDNGAESPFAGHCYLSYFHVPSGELRTATSTDGARRGECR